MSRIRNPGDCFRSHCIRPLKPCSTLALYYDVNYGLLFVPRSRSRILDYLWTPTCAGGNHADHVLFAVYSTWTGYNEEGKRKSKKEFVLRTPLLGTHIVVSCLALQSLPIPLIVRELYCSEENGTIFKFRTFLHILIFKDIFAHSSINQINYNNSYFT